MEKKKLSLVIFTSKIIINFVLFSRCLFMSTCQLYRNDKVYLRFSNSIHWEKEKKNFSPHKFFSFLFFYSRNKMKRKERRGDKIQQYNIKVTLAGRQCQSVLYFLYQKQTTHYLRLVLLVLLVEKKKKLWLATKCAIFASIFCLNFCVSQYFVVCFLSRKLFFFLLYQIIAGKLDSLFNLTDVS